MNAGRLPSPLNRRFEAVIFDPHLTTEATADRLRNLIDFLRAAGMRVCGVSESEAGDISERVRSLLDELWAIGLGPGLVLMVGDDFGIKDGLPGRDAAMLVTKAARSTVVSLGVEPSGVPPGVIRLGGGPEMFLRLLEDQMQRRRDRSVPEIDVDPAWAYEVKEFDHESEGARETLLSIGDGLFGTAGAPLDSLAGTTPRVLVAGVYSGHGAATELLACPMWDRSGRDFVEGSQICRTLDLHTGILVEATSFRGAVRRAFRFSSLSRPGTMVLRAEGPGHTIAASPPLSAPGNGVRAETGGTRNRAWMRVRSTPGGVVAAARQVRSVKRDVCRLERMAAYVPGPKRCPRAETAARALAEAEAKGFDNLLAEHRASWAERWRDADIRIEGDPELELAVRFALFHLICSVASAGQAALGARGMSGKAYRGHVFWDSDVFVLPFLAATHPSAARAMLEYRAQRLPAARAAAVALGRKGARFPWESALTGRDVTPRFARGANGREIEIRTGLLEEHIVADVAWAAQTYVDWADDRAFCAVPGRALIVETARYWASRIRMGNDGRAHIYGVIGPDEYHEAVDDNAFTNVMARWNLRQAVRIGDISARERRVWRDLARLLVDGYDRRSGLYEQFAGFWKLEPLIIKDLAPRRPVAADLLLGLQRVQESQVVKQADVLMLYLMVPNSTVRGSLAANLDFYEPRTAHGSSLSPAVHAALLARAGRVNEALDALRITARLDLDDLTRTTAGGLHIATMGGLWQALVSGFAGVRPTATGLIVDPHLPPAWQALEIPLHYHGGRLRLRIEPGIVRVLAERPLTIRLSGGTATRVPAGTSVYRLSGSAWKEIPA